LIKPRRPRSLGALVSLVVAGLASAAVPSFWRLESQADFLPGEADGVSISSDGILSLAPATQVLTEATDPHFWSLAVDRSGSIFVGSGNDGKIYRVEPSGTSRVIADTNELQVHALAIDRRGNLFAGTSPRGAVYKIAGDGAQEVFFDPEDRYIWALAVDSAGNLIVATGDRARIHRVNPSGQGEVLFTSEETHIVSVAIDADDTIYAGTDSNGLVLRVDKAGATSVIFDTPFQEVRAVVLDSHGNVYAAALNGAPRGQEPAAMPTPATPPVSVAVGGETVTVTTSMSPMISAVQSPAAMPLGIAVPGSVGGLFRISPDGAFEQLWQSATDAPLSLAVASDDRLMIGSSTEGRVFLVSQDKTSALLLGLDADQVTAVRPVPSGEAFLATSNPAKLYRMNRGRRTEAVYRSPAMDTKTISSWGRIRWDARTPPGTTVKLQTRSGNSAQPDNTWSDWSQPYASPEGEQIASPRSRFLQWRAVLNSTGEVSPELLDVTAIYLQQNFAPEVSEISINPPGQTYQKPILATGQLEILGMEETISETQATNGTPAPVGGQPAMSLTAIARPFYRKGMQTVTWKASDPNDDELRFDVHYRGEGESLWKVLRQGLRSPVIAWDTVAMPDGRYTLRVVASDAVSNPVASARTGERISRSFEVDNTPPRFANLATQTAPNGHRVVFQVEDDTSPIQTVEYSVNSGKWNLVFPIDGIADSRNESFDFLVEGYRDGVYTLVVKVTDILGNAVTARAELR
jgi:sugar lactone lactonase YvrE